MYIINIIYSIYTLPLKRGCKKNASKYISSLKSLNLINIFNN